MENLRSTLREGAIQDDNVRCFFNLINILIYFSSKLHQVNIL